MAEQDSLFTIEPRRCNGKISILGVPLDVGAAGPGQREAPNYLRLAGLAALLKNNGFEVVDAGDIAVPPREEMRVGHSRLKYFDAILPVARATAFAVHAIITSGSRPVVLGGDNAITLGTLAGVSASFDRDFGVIWIDAHGDINTHETTISGNIHGMPAAAMLGYGHPEFVNLFAPAPHVKPENTLFIGLKDLDSAEVDLIRRLNIPVVTAFDIARHGLDPAFRAIENICKRVKQVWVMQDMDAIDCVYAPATLMVNNGGLTHREITNLTRFIGRTCSVVGLEVVELVPSLDPKGITTHLALEIIANLLGGEYSWYAHYMEEYEREQRETEIKSEKQCAL